MHGQVRSGSQLPNLSAVYTCVFVDTQLICSGVGMNAAYCLSFLSRSPLCAGHPQVGHRRAL